MSETFLRRLFPEGLRKGDAIEFDYAFSNPDELAIATQYGLPTRGYLSCRVTEIAFSSLDEGRSMDSVDFRVDESNLPYLVALEFNYHPCREIPKQGKLTLDRQQYPAINRFHFLFSKLRARQTV
jgi:hypothetical protein